MSEAERAGRSAAEAFDAALAELGRARPLFVGPLTRSKKALLMDRIRSGARSLAEAYRLVGLGPVDADPLPSNAERPAATRRGVVDFTQARERRSHPARNNA